MCLGDERGRKAISVVEHKVKRTSDAAAIRLAVIRAKGYSWVAISVDVDLAGVAVRTSCLLSARNAHDCLISLTDSQPRTRINTHSVILCLNSGRRSIFNDALLLCGSSIDDTFSVYELVRLFAADALSDVANVAEQAIGVNATAALTGIVVLQDIPSRTILAL